MVYERNYPWLWPAALTPASLLGESSSEGLTWMLDEWVYSYLIHASKSGYECGV